jgi:hypothetical protein
MKLTDHLVGIMIGLEVSVDHPLTVLNPDRFFIITEVKMDDGLYIRGKDTCWFNANIATLKDS